MISPIASDSADEMLDAVHGGPDAQGIAPHDFSTNGNACGPCDEVVGALRAVDAAHYPDPLYVALRQRLAGFHGVAPERIVVAASASEFIFRITAAAVRRGAKSVVLPLHGYGDYAKAAVAWGLQPAGSGSGSSRPGPSLIWLCDPSSPLGRADAGIGSHVDSLPEEAVCVLDLAYEPLRLEGTLALDQRRRDRLWQLWTPNKALGLTGIRAAYAIAPRFDGTHPSSAAHRALLQAVHGLAPSWPLGAHGVALLESWISPSVQGWLAQSLDVLRDWKAVQVSLCRSFGWEPLPSAASFFCVRLPDDSSMGVLARHLRTHGVKVRDTASFGLPGHFRLAVAVPASRNALEAAMRSVSR